MLDPSEIDIMMEESASGWGMVQSVYCGSCGYNLKGLSYSGVCPECGNRYNARDHTLRGIFVPRNPPNPAPLIFYTIMSLGIGGSFAIASWKIASLEWLKFFAAVFLAMGAVYCWFTWKKICAWIRFKSIYRKILRDEDG